MSTAGPWSVKGIDPKAREIAKDLARRSGMTLGEWLNHMIIEGDDEPGAESSPFDRSWLDAPRTRSQAASFSATDSLRARLNRELGREPPPPIGHNSEAGELQRIAKAIAALGERIETGEHRSTLSISGIDQQVMGVLGRVENAERDQTALAARIEGSLDEVRSGQGKLAERLRRFDGDEAARMEAVKALEGALTKVAGQIYEGESQARTQTAQLREDVAALARRVERADRSDDSAVAERRLEAVAAELMKRIEAVRAEAEARMAQVSDERASDGKIDRLESALNEIVARLGENEKRAADASDSKLDRVEDALKDIAAKVGDSEKRSSETVDRMGREVMRVAQSMSNRVQAVEQRSAAASEQMGSEMARIAEAMEARVRRTDSAQAEALEKLGGEIARIAEKLADRIAASERRAAGGMTHMSDQLAGVTDRLSRAHDQSAVEIADRIRASEERTAKLLADTQESIDRRLGEAARRPPVSDFAMPPAPTSTASQQPGFSAEPAAQAFDAFAAAPFASGAPPAYEDPFAAVPAPATARNVFDDFPPEQPFRTDPGFGPSATESAPEPAPAARSNRDLIASARAAARAAAESRGRSRGGVDPFSDEAPAYEPAPFAPENFGPPPGVVEYTAPEIEAAAGRARSGALGFGFPLPRRKKREGTALKTMLMASAVAAGLSVMAVGAVGVVAMDGKGGAKRTPDAPSAAPDPKAALAALERSAADPAPSMPTADDTAASDRLAMAVSPEPTLSAPAKSSAAASPAPPVAKTAAAPTTLATTSAPPAAAQPAPAAASRTLYSAAVRTIEGGDKSGVEILKKAANLGYGPAEFYLAKLYENGSSGLAKDPAEARRWTERAAQTGDSKAMHNLALYWFEGSGGPKDPAQAADWFKRAAERGVQDSQYNLARLYEQGFGVPKNTAEAYKWYLVAGANGDPESKTGADTVKRSLTPEAQASAERAASTFRAQIAASQLRTASTQ